MGQPIYAAQTGTGSTQWYPVNTGIGAFNLGIGVNVTGTVTFNFQYTYDDVTGTYPNPLNASPTVFSLSALNAKSANTDSFINFPISAWRLNVSAGTGTAQAIVIQSGFADS